MRDSGSIVVGWLGKLVLVLGLLGLVVFDGLAVVVASFNASDHAATAAREAADTMKRTHNVQAAYDAAVAVIDPAEKIDPKSFTVDEAGTVRLVVHRTAKTIWLQRVGPLEKYAEVRQSGTGKPYV